MQKIRNKKIIILSILLCMLFLSEAYAATYSTSATGSSQGYKVTARANWQYSTGKYAGKGTHTINSKPKNTLTTIYLLEYMLSHPEDYKVTQYFRPKYYNTLIDRYTYGYEFGVIVRSSGPR